MSLKETYTNYFIGKGHKHLQSASLIPNNPTTLFTTAGVQPIIPYILGGKEHPEGKRLTSFQKCLRLTDIDSDSFYHRDVNREYIDNTSNYNRDYELVIATVLSAQCTDKRVNEVTQVLFSNYDIYGLAKADKKDIERIIRSCGSYTKKAGYIIEIAKSLIDNYNGVVPNDREYLESLPGVGRKTTNVVLSNLFNIPCIAVDTHVERVSKRLKIAKNLDSVLTVEKKLMKMIPQDLWSRSHHQLVLFGRYICKARGPICSECAFYDDCTSRDKKKM